MFIVCLNPFSNYQKGEYGTTLLLKQTLKNVETFFRDFAGFEMSYDELKEYHRSDI